MGYYKNLNIDALNKERDKISDEDLSKWDKEQLVQWLYLIKKSDFEAFFEGYEKLEEIRRGN